MPCLCRRLLREAYAGGLCTMLVRRLSACLIRRALEFEFLVASTCGLGSPVCGLYGRLMHRSERRPDDRSEKQRQRETETEKERQRKRQTHRPPATDKHRHRETASNRVAHRALCKPLMRISLSQNLSCCLCAAWFLLSGAVFWLMRAYALPTWFEESHYAGCCGNFLDNIF